MTKLILLLFLTSCGTTTTTLFSDLDNESFKKRYYTETSQNRFRTDGVYYTFDSTEVYETTFLSNMPYREKSFMDSDYPNSEYVNFDTTFKAYFISLVWFTENGKVFFSEHGQFDEGASPGVEVIRREVDVDSLKYHLLNEKLNYIEKNTFISNNYHDFYSNKGFYRVSCNDMVIRNRRHSQHYENHYEEGFEAEIVNDTTINYYIYLMPITGYHDFIFYKTDIQPSETFMRISE